MDVSSTGWYLCHPCAGYDTGVISGALVTIGGDLGPTQLSSTQEVGVLLEFELSLTI